MNQPIAVWKSVDDGPFDVVERGTLDIESFSSASIGGGRLWASPWDRRILVLDLVRPDGFEQVTLNGDGFKAVSADVDGTAFVAEVDKGDNRLRVFRLAPGTTGAGVGQAIDSFTSLPSIAALSERAAVVTYMKNNAVYVAVSAFPR